MGSQGEGRSSQIDALRAFVRAQRSRGRLGDLECDVVQETILRAIRRAKAGGEEVHLCAIARNVIRERRRERGGRVVCFSDLPEGFAVDGADASSPAAALEQREAIARLLRALDGLREEHREVLLARYWSGWSVPRIAVERGASLEATKSVLRRAAAALRVRLKSLHPGPRPKGAES